MNVHIYVAAGCPAMEHNHGADKEFSQLRCENCKDYTGLHEWYLASKLPISIIEKFFVVVEIMCLLFLAPTQFGKLSTSLNFLAMDIRGAVVVCANISGL